MTTITVIGSGVIGLSASLALQSARFNVRLLSRDPITETASFAAGALWSGGTLSGRERHWARASLKHFLHLATQPSSGVTLSRMRLVYPQALHDPWYRDLLPFFQRIPTRDLPPQCQTAFLMDIPIIAPPRYLTYLKEQFLAAGGTLETRSVQSLTALSQECPLLVNCTGVWARHIASDPAVFPIRGQSLLIKAPSIQQGYMRDSDSTYLFPRQDGILIGGIYQYQAWNRDIDPQQSHDILTRCARIEPSLKTAPILRTAVGLRPGREQVRLEIERPSQKARIIHNYGHGSIGFTLSWGCALETRKLAQYLTGDTA